MASSFFGSRRDAPSVLLAPSFRGMQPTTFIIAIRIEAIRSSHPNSRRALSSRLCQKSEIRSFASLIISSRSRPAGPTNGYPIKSSDSPGPSPRNTISAGICPLTKTTFVLVLDRGHRSQIFHFCLCSFHRWRIDGWIDRYGVFIVFFLDYEDKRVGGCFPIHREFDLLPRGGLSNQVLH